MDLQTGRMSRRGHCKKCKMTKLVIDTVNEMAYRQGYKSLKFLNRKKQPMLLNPIDTLEGIRAMVNDNVEALEQADEDFMPMLAPTESQHDEDSELIVDSGVDANEIADILDDGASDHESPGDVGSVDENNQPELDEDESEIDDPDPCAPIDGDLESLDAPSLVSEPKGRPTRERNPPER